jgi:flagellar biosynthesis regulator FlaF
MDENAKASDPEEQAVTSRRPRQFSHAHRRQDWPESLTEPCEPRYGELELLQGKVPGHRWECWRRLTGDESYFAACSCGWRCSETGDVSPMLSQVEEHLDAVGAVRGWRRSTRTAPAPGREERGVGHREMQPDERTRELYASVANQQRRLSQALERSADLLSASQEQAERFVALLEHAAANVAPEWARTWEAVQGAEVLQGRAERAKELRNGIVAAAGALAAIAEEVGLAGQDLEGRCPSGSAGYRRAAGEPANPHAGREGVADDLRLACGLGRTAD